MNDPECTVCQNTSSPHGMPPVTAPEQGGVLFGPFGAPETAAGQAAREAFGELGADWYPGTPWDELPESLRAQWEAAAQAVITASPLSEERERVIRELEGHLAQAEAAQERPAPASGTAAGQAEYEVWRAAVPDYVCNVPAGPWDELPQSIQAGFAAIAAQERPAPEMADVMRETASRELAAAMAEARAYREALQQVAKHHDDAIAQVRIIAKIARRALEGK